MKLKSAALYSVCILALLTGCSSSNKPKEERFLTEREQKAILAKSKTPQYFGFSAYPKADGSVGFLGAMRLHPGHMTEAEFAARGVPVIQMRGKSRRDSLFTLLDPSSPTSWMEYSTAADLKVNFLGINDHNFPYTGTYNTGRVNAYAGVIGNLRVDMFFMENIPFYIRMAEGSLGPLARGVLSPNADAVLGYDNLSQLEYIQFFFRSGKVILSATTPYVPHEALLMAEVPIVQQEGFGLTVSGDIYGEPTPIVLDLAGDFTFARGDAKVAVTKQVSMGDLVFRKVPTMLMEPNQSLPRVGRQLVDDFIITVCPRAGVVYFERYPEDLQE